MRNRKLLMLLAVVSGLVTSFLVYAFVSSETKGKGQPAIKMIEVIVAKSNIPARTAITAAMLEKREIPQQVTLPDVVTKEEDAVGAVAKESILAGETVVKGRLWPKDGRPGLTFVIPPGRRAVTIKVDEVIGVAGFVKPGDYVDVLGTFDQETMGKDLTGTVLQHVQVLAISQQMQDDGKQDAKVSTTVTLSVSLEEAQKVTLAEERGKLRLVLRPPTSETLKEVPVVTPESVVQQRATPRPSAAPPRTTVVITPKPVVIEVIRGSRVDQVKVQ